MTKTMSYADAERNLAAALDLTAETGETIIIERRGKPKVALINAAELANLQATVKLLSSPTNARRIFDALDRLDGGDGVEMTIDQLEALVHDGIQRHQFEASSVADYAACRIR